MKQSRDHTVDDEVPLITGLPADRIPSQSGLADAPDGHDRIAEQAYFYWQARGCPEGSSEEDWFRAEHDISYLQEVSSAANAA